VNLVVFGIVTPCILVSGLSTLKMEVIRSPEMFVTAYIATRCHNSKYHNGRRFKVFEGSVLGEIWIQEGESYTRLGKVACCEAS
jgi:hypothetical protein